MTIDLTSEERELLHEILVDRLGTLREQVRHSMTSTFTDELKHAEELVRSMIDRLAAAHVEV